MRLDNLNLICKALYCQPNHLILFKQDTNSTVAYPLTKLLQSVEDNNWQQQLKTMPLEKLKQISKLLDQTENQK